MNDNVLIVRCITFGFAILFGYYNFTIYARAIVGSGATKAGACGFFFSAIWNVMIKRAFSDIYCLKIW